MSRRRDLEFPLEILHLIYSTLSFSYSTLHYWPCSRNIRCFFFQMHLVDVPKYSSIIGRCPNMWKFTVGLSGISVLIIVVLFVHFFWMTFSFSFLISTSISPAISSNYYLMLIIISPFFSCLLADKFPLPLWWDMGSHHFLPLKMNFLQI